MIYAPSALRSFLKSLGIKPSKRLSQNFLIDGNIVRKIVKLAEVKSKDQVLEIGPGPGALTEELLKQGALVWAIEKDRKLGEALHRLSEDHLQVFIEDAKTFAYETLPSNLKVIANLPYHITSSLLEALFKHHQQFQSLTLMMQKEVADRLFAKPSTKEFSSLTIFTEFYTDPKCKARFTVKANAFYPKPKVDSSVVHLKMRASLPVKEEEAFFKIVRTAFQKRRKKLTSSLKEICGKERVENALKSCSLSIDMRPEDLSLDRWLAFFSHLESQ